MTTPAREAIERNDPVLADLIDQFKATFNAKVKYVRTADGFEAGNAREFESEGIIPAPPPAIKQKGSSSLDQLKQREQEHIAAHARTQQAGAGAQRRAAGRRRA